MIYKEIQQPISFHIIEQTKTVPDDLVIFKQLNKAKFAVFGAYSQSFNQNYAVKVFPFHNDNVNTHFLKEAYFSQFNHPNIVSIIDCKIQQTIPHENTHINVSYIVMELAPFGDFFDIIMNYKIKFNEKLARTYFRQLVEGVEHIHSKGAAHLDLKLENLLLGNDLQLKIADFDTAYVKSQGLIYSKGTICYRAPEILNATCKDPQAADIYSIGILLFTFKCGGKLPYKEEMIVQGIDLFGLPSHHKSLFWQKHCETQRRDNTFFDGSFKDLFESMVQINPSKRARLSDIKNSKWFNGPVFTTEECQNIMAENLQRAG